MQESISSEIRAGEAHKKFGFRKQMKKSTHTDTTLLQSTQLLGEVNSMINPDLDSHGCLLGRHWQWRWDAARMGRTSKRWWTCLFRMVRRKRSVFPLNSFFSVFLKISELIKVTIVFWMILVILLKQPNGRIRLQENERLCRKVSEFPCLIVVGSGRIVNVAVIWIFWDLPYGWIRTVNDDGVEVFYQEATCRETLTDPRLAFSRLEVTN